MGALRIGHKLHEVKLLAHVKKLKEKCFAKRIKQLSPQLDQWHAGHVAAWLHVNVETQKCATSILKSKANGNTLLDLYIDDDDKPLRDLRKFSLAAAKMRHRRRKTTRQKNKKNRRY